MDFSKELLTIVNDKTDEKKSKKATGLLSQYYTTEEKRTELFEKLTNFILSYKVKGMDEVEQVLDPLTESKPKKRTALKKKFDLP
jgi:hypothetical protein